MKDDYRFPPGGGTDGTEDCWNILIIDDDYSVHEAMKYALSGFAFKDRGIRWFEAYSSTQAREIVKTREDIAVIFLDVVMEYGCAGLDFARWFRDEGVNLSTRIILCTGQPGQAPERRVMVEYDLHDYRTKAELSSERLFSATVAALRAYSDISRLETARAGLEGIIKSGGEMFRIHTARDYAANVLARLSGILGVNGSGMICAQTMESGKWELLAESGVLVRDKWEVMDIMRRGDGDAVSNGDYIACLLSETGDCRYAVYLEPAEALNDIQMDVLMTFSANISVGLDNIDLYKKLNDSYVATVMSLARVTEMRDVDTGEHVLRIARGARELAEALYASGFYRDQITEHFREIIGLAATLHDIGKVSIPDRVLLKPEALSDDEYELMKTHSENGADILQTALEYAGDNVDYLEMGKLIARYHHERWDGSGYPKGLRGETVPLAARITAVLDVFDALVNKRCYKEPLTMEESLMIIREGRGTLFDPVITDVFLGIVDGLGYGSRYEWVKRVAIWV